jgi:hypothetical protein
MNTIRAALAASALLVTLFAGTLASAQADARKEAKRHYDDGVDRFSQGDHAGALTSFQKAYDLAPLPIVLYNVAQAHAALGRPVEALDALDKVLASPGSLSAERLEQARLTRAEQSARVGEIEVIVSQPGATVELDGAAVGPSPAKLRVKLGPHRLGAVLEGFAPLRKDVTVASGSATRVVLELQPTEAPLAKLLVRTSLPGATVKVDGQSLAMTPMAAAIAVLPGSLDLEVTRPGYQPVKRPLVVDPGKSADIEITLEEDPGEITRLGGAITLDASEDTVVVQIDGKPRGVYGAAIPVAPGPHRVVLERGGFITVSRDVVVMEGGPTLLKVRFSPTPETLVKHVDAANARRVGGWVGFGIGLGLAGGMAGLLGWNQTTVDDTNRRLAAFNLSAVEGSHRGCDSLRALYDETYCERRRADLVDDIDDLKTRRIIAAVGLGVGAAGAITGLVLALTGDDPHKYDRPLSDELARSLRPIALPLEDGAVLGVMGRF